MTKKVLIIAALLITLSVAGLFVWRAQDSRVKASKTDAEIVKGLTAEEIGLILKSQASSDGGAAVEYITQTPEARQAFLKGLREHLALAAEARREGLADDASFKINLEYKRNILLADLYRAKLSKEQGKYYVVPAEELKAVWNNADNEKQFNTDMDTLLAIQKAMFEMRGNANVPSKLQGESLEKARDRWASTKILSDKAKADAEFMKRPELPLRFKVLEAGILSTNYLRKHWTDSIKPTEQEINAYLAAHPEFDLKKKREKAEAVLQRAKAGDDFNALVKEFSEHRPTKETGGLFENVVAGQLSPEIDNAVLALEKGQIADKLIETEIGWYIIKLENKQTKKDNNGNDTAVYSIRQILFQNKFEQPGIVNPDIPPPFMTAEEIAKEEVEKEKRDKFVQEVIQRSQIKLPNDFTVELPDADKAQSVN